MRLIPRLQPPKSRRGLWVRGCARSASDGQGREPARAPVTFRRRSARMAQSAQKLAKAVATRAPQLVSAAVSFSRPRLATFWHYARVELAPPRPADIPQAVDSIKGLVRSFQAGRPAQLTVKEALRNGLVATEVLMWFFVGEILGKRGLVGYDV